MAESAVASVLARMVTAEAAFLRSVRGDAELLRADLRGMQCFLRDADAMRRRHSERVTNWVVDVRAAAYDAEDALEGADLLDRRRALQRGCAGVLAWCADLVALHFFGVKIRSVRARIREISTRTVAYGITDLGDEASASLGPQHPEPTPLDPLLVVGLDRGRDEIIKALTNPETLQICVVCIVGMGGSGKSTLAREIYNFFDAQAQQHFQALYWFVVPQKYRFLDLIKDVAKRVMNIKRMKVREERNDDGQGSSKDDEKKKNPPITAEALEKMDEEEVRELLREELAHRRFLVVLDDVWRCHSYGEINGIIKVFPDVNNGSRIVLTTRDANVAKHVANRKKIHEMQLLDEGQSWELLEKVAFQDDQKFSTSDRSQLTPIGKKLALKCKGLPLALVVLGGYLSRERYDKWLALVDDLDWEARKDDEPVWGILARSYNDLPCHQLKSCFLYLASFTEGHIIRVKRLIKLLIAEGCVPERHNRTMEDTAREYINELSQRCMLQVVDRSKVDDSIKSVVLHDILRDWGIKEASREGFFNIWCNTTPPLVYAGSMPAYRIALHNFSGRSQIVAFMPKVRTLWLCGSLSKELGLCGLTFLRVLDLYDIKDLEELPSGIGKMMHLRYLGLQNCGRGSIYIPPSVLDLLNLQTLDARNSRTRSLPPYFWDVPTFRHIHLSNVYCWDAPEVGCLPLLQTLHFSGVCSLLPVEDFVVPKQRRIARQLNVEAKERNYRKWISMAEALSEMKQLVSLHLENWYSVRDIKKKFPEEKRYSRNTAIFPEELITVLSGHSRLRVLELSGQFPPSFPIDYLTMLPCNLNKLKLTGSKFLKDPMPVLGKLLNLVVLTLEDGSYQGKEMTCNVHGFPRLQYLTFDEVHGVRHWNIDVGAFPSLIQLNLILSFGQMTLPPQGLLHVKSLQELHLHALTRSYENISHQNIEKLTEMGCNVKIRYHTSGLVPLQKNRRLRVGFV